MANTPPVSLRIPTEFQTLIRQALNRLKKENGFAGRLQALLMDSAEERAAAPLVLDEICRRLEMVEKRLERVEFGQANDAASPSLPTIQSGRQLMHYDPAWKTKTGKGGHLTKAGVNAIVRMFDDKLSDNEIIALMEISQASVISYRNRHKDDNWAGLRTKPDYACTPPESS